MGGATIRRLCSCSSTILLRSRSYQLHCRLPLQRKNHTPSPNSLLQTTPPHKIHQSPSFKPHPLTKFTNLPPSNHTPSPNSPLSLHPLTNLPPSHSWIVSTLLSWHIRTWQRLSGTTCSLKLLKREPRSTSRSPLSAQPTLPSSTQTDLTQNTQNSMSDIYK